MQIFKYSLVGVLGAFIFSGCSSKYEVTFDSNPRGATLICDGRNFGYTPKKLYYDEEVKKYKEIDVSSCSANWVSGYSENYPKNMTIFLEGGSVVTLNRPTYGEGYPADAQFALQVEQMKAQATAAEEANNRAAWDSINRSIEKFNNNMQMQQLNNNLMMNNMMPKRYDVYVH